jgi:hypothetical protein
MINHLWDINALTDWLAAHGYFAATTAPARFIGLLAWLREHGFGGL